MAESRTKRRRAPAQSPEAAERRCTMLAYSLAEKQLEDGNASPSVITHFLKLATERSKLEREKLSRETELLQTKNVAIQESKNMQEMLSDAMNMMKRYQGNMGEDEEDYDEDW